MANNYVVILQIYTQIVRGLCLRYFDPQYFLRRQLTTASDVYSFGVVLLELISGRKAIMLGCPDLEETNIIEWVKSCLQIPLTYVQPYLNGLKTRK